MVRPGTINAADGTVLPTGVQLGLGCAPAAVSMHLAQGSLSATGGDLDLAIDGAGFIEVTLPSGQAAYTRDGGLKRSGDGLIVTSDGFRSRPISPFRKTPARSRSTPMARFYAYFDDAAEAQLLGQFNLVGFTNPNGLEARGSNLFTETEASGPPVVSTPGQDGLGTLRQGYLEDSSVDPVREITELDRGPARL